MSIPNEALQKLLQEIETQVVASHQNLSITKAQITAKQKNSRLLELTSKELGSLPKETKVYEGVGKMFVGVPMQSVDKRLSSENSTLKSEISGLEKKLDYYDTTHTKARENLEAIIKPRK